MTIIIDPITVQPIANGVIRVEPVIIGKRLFGSNATAQPFLSYDSFTRANGVLGSSESVGPSGETAQSIAWNASGWSIASGVVQSGEINVFALQSCGISNVTISVTVRALAEAAGIYARCDSATNPTISFQMFQAGSSVVILESLPEGSSLLAEYVSEYVANDVLKLVLSGTSWQAYKNDILLGSGTTVIVDGTIHGMFSSISGDKLDNWTCRG